MTVCKLKFIIIHLHLHLQWNPTITDLYKEVSLIQGLVNTNMVFLGPNTVSFIMPLFQNVHIEVVVYVFTNFSRIPRKFMII